MKRFIWLCLLLPFLAGAQTDSTKKVVQITGICVSSDSLQPIPFTRVIVKGNYTGTLSDFSGFYSIVASTGDTLLFSSMGFQLTEYVIPDTLESKHYSLIQMLDHDTIQVPLVEIKAWPTYQQFKEAFVETEVPDDELARAERNLDAENINEQAANLNMGAAGNQKYMLDQYRSRLYYAGQLPPNNLLNPIAWAKFIKAWKEGKLSTQ